MNQKAKFADFRSELTAVPQTTIMNCLLHRLGECNKICKKTALFVEGAFRSKVQTGFNSLTSKKIPALSINKYVFSVSHNAQKQRN